MKTITVIMTIFKVRLLIALFFRDFSFQPGTNSTPSTLQCLCNHLTSFGGYFVVAPNTIDFDQVRLGLKSIHDPGDVPVIVAVSAVFLLYLIAVVFARRADKRDLEKVRLLNVIYMNSIRMCHTIQCVTCQIICRIICRIN